MAFEKKWVKCSETSFPVYIASSQELQGLVFSLVSSAPLSLHSRLASSATKESTNRFRDPCPEGCIEALSCLACNLHGQTYDYAELHRRSKYMLVISGDTPTTSRLYDALAAGMIPVVVSDYMFEVGLPFPSTVPWHSMVFWIPERFLSGSSIQKLILDAPEREIVRRLTLIQKHRDDLLWHSPSSRVVNSILIEAKFSCAIPD